MIPKKVLKLVRSRGKPKIVAIDHVEGLTPNEVNALEAKVIEYRLNGRPQGLFMEDVRKSLLANGHDAPIVIESEQTDSTSVTASLEGLLVFVASWDALLLDEELISLKSVVAQMIPMGLNHQDATRRERAERQAADEHAKAEHAEAFAASQGIQV